MFFLFRYAHTQRLTLHSSLRLLIAFSIVVVVMLYARQAIQDFNLLPFEKQFAQNRAAYAETLEPYTQLALSDFESTLAVPYKNPFVIYERSCAFCHGAVMNGEGFEARNLKVPPEDLTAVRGSSDALIELLRRGVPGSAMPRFRYYTAGELEELIFYVDQWAMKKNLEEPPVSVTDAQLREGSRIYALQCAACHGGDGAPSVFGGGLRPPPPDFRRINFSPEKIFQVVSEGYPGTAMLAFPSIDENSRWALAVVVNGFYEE